MVKTFELYTDGSTHGSKENCGGGWAFCVLKGKEIFTGYGYAPPPDTPKHRAAIGRMELLAVLNGLKYCYLNMPRGCMLRIFSDAQFISDTFYFRRWEEWKGDYTTWKRSDGVKLANADVWEQVLRIIKTLERNGTKLIFYWVKGHSGVKGNESVDKLAKKARDGKGEYTKNANVELPTYQYIT